MALRLHDIRKWKIRKKKEGQQRKGRTRLELLVLLCMDKNFAACFPSVPKTSHMGDCTPTIYRDAAVSMLAGERRLELPLPLLALDL